MSDDIIVTTEPSPFTPAPPDGPPPPETADETGSGDASKRRHYRTAIEWGLLLLAAVVLALLIKTFLFQAFYIPSESMVPTLEVGDRVLVNKLSYDLHDVNRGDIVVFESEPNPDWRDTGITDLVKRVIGLPGETITECGQTEELQGKVCIDGRVLDESYLPEGTTTTFPDAHGQGCANDSPAHGCAILPGHYFVMGDNRGRSADARIHGPVKGSSIVGRVFVRIWPVNRLGFL
ncbi:MAG: signal peptidase I [Acidimicrobiia bacterium]